MTDATSPIVGIDLGTTNSAVAVVIDGQPQVLEIDGQQTLPSVVGLGAEGRLITGTVARNQLAAFPDRTIASIKRRMGTMEPVLLGDQSFTPPEISAMILRRLRDVASRALGQEVTRAVITVPAFFDENQRQATREAGELAGLTVERIINEPTAATLVYHASSQDRKQIAVFDFGGGTFDVSVVRMESGVIEVLSSQGDTQLGGDDLDEALLQHLADQFQDQHGVDLRDDPQARYRLLHACEKAKIALSTNETASVIEEFIAEKDGQPLNLSCNVDRETFNELIEPMVDRTIDCVGRALRDASLTIHQIDDLVLVGGSTRAVLVEEKLRRELLHEPSRAVDPDLAVALGAAVQGAILQGQDVGPVLVDVTSHTLGIEACEGMSYSGPELVFSPVIHRNSPLPARYEEGYSTMHDEQKVVDIHVLQGEYDEIERNVSIGKFKLDLQQGDGKHRKIVVRFDLTLDGMLKVTATQPASGTSNELTIENALSQFVAKERDRVQTRLGEMFDASSELMNEDDLPPKSEFHGDVSIDGAHATAGEPKLATIEKLKERYPEAVGLLEKAEALRGNVQGDDAADLESISGGLIRALESGDESTIAHLSTELDDVLFYVQ